jgi:hypothetical protein
VSGAQIEQEGSAMRMKTNCGALVLVCFVAAQAQSPHFKTFDDPKSGVSFRYPAQWSSASDIAFYFGSLVLAPAQPGEGPENPEANVGFNARKPRNPYAGTNLYGVQFVYHAATAATSADCGKRILAAEDEKKEPVRATIHGVVYDHFSTAVAGLGHQASREIYATFREGQCYMFEGDIHYATPGDPNSMTALQMEHLRKQLDAVMRTVRIRNAR